MNRLFLTLTALAAVVAVAPTDGHGQSVAGRSIDERSALNLDGVDDVAIDVTPDGRPRIRIHADHTTTLRHFELSGPQRLVLDLGATALTASPPEIPPTLRERLLGVRVARFQRDVVRVVVDLPRREAYSVEQQGAWWVVTLDRPNRARAAEPVESPPVEAASLETASVEASPAPTPTPALQQPAAKPDGTLEVRVTRVSGTTVYINAGSNHGLGKGQEVQAERKVGRGRGTLEVLSTSSRGAVLGFAGRPFPLTRGDGLRLKLPQTQGPDRAVADAGAEPRESQPREAQRELAQQPTTSADASDSLDQVFSLPPNVTGHISMELDGRASRSNWDPLSLDVTRTFLSPLTRLQFTARDVGGGMTVRGRMRAAYRYGSDGVIDPAASVRVYEFDAEKRFEAMPLRMQVGRFFSPYEAFSGYWDGLLMRVGGDGAGFGAAVGLEPDRWNQAFSANRPKASGFVDFRRSGGRGGVEGAFSATHVRPTDSRPNQLYFGSSSRMWMGRLGLSHTIQVDQHPDTKAWVISDLLVQSSIPLTRAFEVRGRWSLREPNYFWLDTPFSYRRDDIGVGTTIRWSGGALLTDAALHDVAGDPTRTRSGSAALRLNSVSRARLGMRLGVNVWDATRGRVTTASLAFDRSAGDAWINGGYRIYRSEGLWQNQLTHQIDGTVSWALPDGVRVTALSSTLVGSGILQQRLQIGFGRSF